MQGAQAGWTTRTVGAAGAEAGVRMIAEQALPLACAAACCGVAAWLARTFSLPSGAFSEAAEPAAGLTAHRLRGEPVTAAETAGR